MLNDNPVVIKLPRIIKDSKKIEKWEKLWEKANNATYSFPENLSVDEIGEYFSFFVDRLPNKFAFAILGNLAELENTPLDIIEKLFEKGDTGCMVSICLRSDLPDHLLKKCLSSSRQDVVEHVIFNKKVSIEECEMLLQKTLDESTVEAIKRAIAQKKKVYRLGQKIEKNRSDK